MMNRAERRRQKHKKTGQTYTVKAGQVGKYITEETQDIADAAYDKGYSDGIADGFSLMLTIPLEVLMDHYWIRSYQQRLPGFVDRCLEYYERFNAGELNMDEMREDLRRFAGVELKAREDGN